MDKDQRDDQNHNGIDDEIEPPPVDVTAGTKQLAERLQNNQGTAERAAMRASPSAVSSLDALRARGITLTLDDCGTGYSALSRLERLPIDAMKIDKSFLEDAGANGVIARAIIAMGHALGMTIVGEGVETRAQWEFLKREGCDFAQGYLPGRPAAAPAEPERLVDLFG